jgi:GNAT superfamily N-acetyltransferase
MDNDVAIRLCRSEDAAALAELAGQLGYPCRSEDASLRMVGYMEAEDRAIVVAEVEGRVVAWASLEVLGHFYIEPRVEISGFVVDAAHRSQGIGGKVMAFIEAWAASKGYGLLRVRTNSIRKDAHRFYERQGFAREKEQLVYEKPVAPGRLGPAGGDSRDAAR